MKKAEPKTKTYILELMGGGRRKLTIPAHWKITFGNVLPYNKQTGNPYDPPEGWRSRVVFRVYEGNKDNLRAVMHDVLSFRDEAITVLETHPKPVTVARVKKIGDKQDVEMHVVKTDEWIDPLEAVQKEEDENVPERSNRSISNFTF